jgi:hypothetical protein
MGSGVNIAGLVFTKSPGKMFNQIEVDGNIIP